MRINDFEIEKTTGEEITGRNRALKIDFFITIGDRRRKNGPAFVTLVDSVTRTPLRGQVVATMAAGLAFVLTFTR